LLKRSKESAGVIFFPSAAPAGRKSKPNTRAVKARIRRIRERLKAVFWKSEFIILSWADEIKKNNKRIQ
jgi:hypothetical protein